MNVETILVLAGLLLAMLVCIQFTRFVLLLIDRNKQTNEWDTDMKDEKHVYHHVTISVDDRLACLLALALEKPDSSPELKAAIAKLAKETDRLQQAVADNK